MNVEPDPTVRADELLKLEQPDVFVLMPFAPPFTTVHNVYVEACKEVGLTCQRSDEQVIFTHVPAHVLNQIEKAKVIIADLTEINPNVLYEAGYAHARDKFVILTAKDIAEIPFDLRQYQIILHGGDLGVLRSALVQKLNRFLGLSLPSGDDAIRWHIAHLSTRGNGEVIRGNVLVERCNKPNRNVQVRFTNPQGQIIDYRGRLSLRGNLAYIYAPGTRHDEDAHWVFHKPLDMATFKSVAVGLGHDMRYRPFACRFVISTSEVSDSEVVALLDGNPTLSTE